MCYGCTPLTNAKRSGACDDIWVVSRWRRYWWSCEASRWPVEERWADTTGNCSTPKIVDRCWMWEGGRRKISRWMTLLSCQWPPGREDSCTEKYWTDIITLTQFNGQVCRGGGCGGVLHQDQLAERERQKHRQPSCCSEHHQRTSSQQEHAPTPMQISRLTKQWRKW